MKNKDLYQSILYLRRHAQEAQEHLTMMEMGIKGQEEKLDEALYLANRFGDIARKQLEEVKATAGEPEDSYD